MPTHSLIAAHMRHAQNLVVGILGGDVIELHASIKPRVIYVKYELCVHNVNVYKRNYVTCLYVDTLALSTL